MSKALSAYSPFWASAVLTAVLVLWPAPIALAASKFWKNIAGSGTWNIGNNWSNVSAAGADNGGAPGINDSVTIAPTSGAAPTIDYNATTILTELFVDFAGAGTSTLSMPNGTGLTAQRFYVGGWNGGVTSGRGTVNQSSGSVVVSGVGVLDFLDVGVGAGSTGTYNLSGGTLQANTNEYIGDLGTGVFNHTGGTNTVSGAGHSLYLGGGPSNGTGTYTISGSGSTSTLSVASDVVVGNAGTGTGTLTIQNLGSVQIANNLVINNLGTVNLNGGTLRFNAVGGTGGLSRLNYTSGTIQIPSTAFNGAPVTTLFGATPTIPTGKSLVIETIAFLNPGFSVVVNGGRLEMASLLNSGSSFLSVTAGSVFIGDAAFVNRGIINVSGPNSSLQVAGSLTVETAPNFGSPDAVLAISNGSTVYIEGDVIINHPGFEFPPTAAVNLDGGTLRFKDYIKLGNAFGAQFNYTAGTIQLSGNRVVGADATISTLFGASPTIPAGKGLTVEGTATLTASPLTLSGGTLSADTLVMSPASRLTTTQASVASGKVAGLAGSVIDATGGNLSLGNASAVNGFGTQGTLVVGDKTVTILDANDAVFDSLSLATLGSGASPGTLNAANGLTLDFGGNLTGFGTVSTPNLLAKPLINNGHITGTSGAQRITLPGYVKGVGSFDNVTFTGTISPGFSPTILTVGNIALSNTSTLVMELGGTAAGGGYDQIQSSGALAFDGTLQISIINGFTPAAGQSFNLFDWLSTSGTFDSLALPTLAALAWNTSQLYTTGVLSLVTAVGLAGDYNDDDTVDAADYTVWRDNLGRPTALPNDDTPGVGLDDYERWKDNFGQPGSGSLTPPQSGGDAAVPEPAAFALVFIVLLSICLQPQHFRAN